MVKFIRAPACHQEFITAHACHQELIRATTCHQELIRAPACHQKVIRTPLSSETHYGTSMSLRHLWFQTYLPISYWLWSLAPPPWNLYIYHTAKWHKSFQLFKLEWYSLVLLIVTLEFVLLALLILYLQLQIGPSLTVFWLPLEGAWLLGLGGLKNLKIIENYNKAIIEKVVIRHMANCHVWEFCPTGTIRFTHELDALLDSHRLLQVCLFGRNN